MIQLSLEVADRPGELSRVVSLLSDHHIDIKALYLCSDGDRPGSGKVRMIVTDIAGAMRAFDQTSLHPRKEEVVVVAMDDHPGGLSGILAALAKADINVLYAYSFVSRIEGKAMSVLGVADPAFTRKVLREAGATLVDGPPQLHGGTYELDRLDLAEYLGGRFFW